MQILISVLLFSFITMLGGGTTTKPAENKNVHYKATVVEKSLKPGSSGTLQIVLTPAKGIHVNIDPPMSIKFDGTKELIALDTLMTHKDEKKGYLDATKPIEIKFTLGKKIKPGPLTITGAFTYFYCSDAEGWCNRFKQPVELTITVSK